METYNAASWLLDRHIEAGSADNIAVRYRGRDVSYGAMQRLDLAGAASARRHRCCAATSAS